MAANGFAYSHRFAKDLPAAAPRWTGFPKYNFIGGHNDPEHVPAAALARAAETVLRRDGADLALYNPHGPQGFRADPRVRRRQGRRRAASNARPTTC